MAEDRDARLHPGRLARCLEAMRDNGVEALLLSRAANVRYASGARRIYSSGTRPFAPACVVTAEGDVHVIGIGEAGVPAHVAAADRHSARWNAADVAATVARIVGGGPARVGVDGMSAGQLAVLRAALPGTVWTDADTVMHAARAVKTVAELEVLAAADRLAGAVAGTLAAEFTSGATGTELRAGAAGAVVDAGAVLAATPRLDLDGGGLRAEIALLVDGYAGEAAVVVPGRRCDAADAALSRLRGAVRAGVGVASLVDGHAASVSVHGLGLGVEPPLAGTRWVDGGTDGTLLAGTVLRLRVTASDGIAAATVVVGADGCAPLPGRVSDDARPTVSPP